MPPQSFRIPSARAIALAAAMGTCLGPAIAQIPPYEQHAPLGGPIAWNSLTNEQKTALKPLESLWATLRSADQREWLAMTENFNRLSRKERATLQGRMAEWSELSPAQRTQARLNFGETRRLSIDDKRARWEEYQSLSPEERKRLAAGRPKPPKGTAPAVRPVSPEKILRSPLNPSATPAPEGATGSSRLNRNTLLPRPPAPAPAPVTPPGSGARGPAPFPAAPANSGAS